MLYWLDSSFFVPELYKKLLSVEFVVFYPNRLHIFAVVRAFFCYCCGGATPRAYKVEEWLRC